MPRIPADPDLFNLPPHLMPEPEPRLHFVCKHGAELPHVVVCARCLTQLEAQRVLGEHIQLARLSGWYVRQESGLPVVVFKRQGEEFVMFIDTVLAAHMRMN